jgi:hypothetical protein
MHIDDLILVAVDDHVVEPRTCFEGHMAEYYGQVQGPASKGDECHEPRPDAGAFRLS